MEMLAIAKLELVHRGVHFQYGCTFINSFMKTASGMFTVV